MILNNILCNCSRRVLANYKFGFNLRLCNREILSDRFPLSQTFRQSSLKSYLKYEKSGESWAAKDKIPQGYDLIYNAPLNKYIITGCTITTTVAGIVLIGSVLTYVIQDINWTEPIMIKDSVYSGSIYEIIGCGALLGLISLAAFIFVWRYALRVYRNGQDYISVFAGVIPGHVRLLSFKAGDVVHIPAKHFVLPWSPALYKVNEKKCIFLHDYFKTYHDLHLMMGGKVHES